LPSQAKKALKGIKFNNYKEVLQALIDKNFIIVMDEKDVFVSDKALFADDVRITQYLQNPDTDNYEITLSNDEAFEVALRDGKCYVQEIKNKEQNNLG
jgi:hypothetical protein